MWMNASLISAEYNCSVATTTATPSTVVPETREQKAIRHVAGQSISDQNHWWFGEWSSKSLAGRVGYVAAVLGIATALIVFSAAILIIGLLAITFTGGQVLELIPNIDVQCGDTSEASENSTNQRQVEESTR